MKDFQERVIDEKIELDEKLVKLKVFLGGSTVVSSLPEEEQARLRIQVLVMTIYSDTLGARIKAFELDEVPTKDELKNLTRLVTTVPILDIDYDYTEHGMLRYRHKCANGCGASIMCVSTTDAEDQDVGWKTIYDDKGKKDFCPQCKDLQERRARKVER